METKRKEASTELSVSLGGVLRVLKSEVTRLLEPYIPWNEFTVLRILYRQKKEMVSKIAVELNVSNSHITAVSEKLIQKGLITRSRSSSDRRVVLLEITEEGKQMTEHVEKVKDQYFQQKFSLLTEEEIVSLNSLLKKLV
ncbi:MarR family transcriptional regulator [Bacillus sp. 165]|uniref:MarR family winged helix-turn-helix transcriptional regulator n=1 Tax=Bacillus sp. 165 TaxID=1529117 RepID=UPI001ADA28D5|nr:MarR family transcriptional regulator [Bacillus sp. 165]MBO9128374.1 MarR family transcriptional regulator [Bacillus sp. 165]